MNPDELLKDAEEEARRIVFYQGNRWGVKDLLELMKMVQESLLSFHSKHQEEPVKKLHEETYGKEASDYICEQHKKIKDLESKLQTAEKECNEQARLNGMGAERELKLISKLQKVEAELALSQLGEHTAEKKIQLLEAKLKHQDERVKELEKDSREFNQKTEAAAWLVGEYEKDKKALEARVKELEAEILRSYTKGFNAGSTFPSPATLGVDKLPLPLATDFKTNWQKHYAKGWNDCLTALLKKVGV